MPGAMPKGLVIINTGDGKGKTTAALGLALRAIGHGRRVAFVQFVKEWSVGEHHAVAMLGPNFELFRTGRGFVMGEPTADQLAAAREGVRIVRECLRGNRFDMVVADEILTAVGLKLLAQVEVESLLDDRPAAVHLVLTGRGAWPALIEKADLVTDMRQVKHPYDKGVEAQAGIEF